MSSSIFNSSPLHFPKKEFSLNNLANLTGNDEVVEAVEEAKDVVEVNENAQNKLLSKLPQ